MSKLGKISLTFSSQGSSIVFGNHFLFCVICRNVSSLSELRYFEVFEFSYCSKGVEIKS